MIAKQFEWNGHAVINFLKIRVQMYKVKDICRGQDIWTKIKIHVKKYEPIWFDSNLIDVSHFVLLLEVIIDQEGRACDR